MTHDIRLATLDDLTSVEAIVQNAYSHYVARIGRKPMPMLADYRALISDGLVHVADMHGAVSGVVVLVPEADALLIENVAVALEAQGRGIGRALLMFAERQAVDAGYRLIRLYTNAAMTENIAFYQRMGYVETHRAGEHGLRRVYMEKTLA